MVWDYLGHSEEEDNTLTYYPDVKVFSVAHLIPFMIGVLGTALVTLVMYLLASFTPQTSAKRGGYFARGRNSDFAFWEVCYSFSIILISLSKSHNIYLSTPIILSPLLFLSIYPSFFVSFRRLLKFVT